jgi:DNA recombination protein RmuC
MPTDAMLAVTSLLLLLVVGLFAAVFYRLRSAGVGISLSLDQRLAAIEGAVSRSDASVRGEFAQGREESREGARSLREEIMTLFGSLASSVRDSVAGLATGQNTRLEDFAGRLNETKTSATTEAKALREEVSQNLKSLGDALAQTLDRMSGAQKERLDHVSNVITNLTQKSGEHQDALRTSVEQRLDAIRTENADKLEHIRQTVDEKLQGTLSERLGASFQVVSDWLEKVHLSIGEMQNLANGVGDLKRLLTNARARGTWGEVALGNILEEIMAPEQFGRNVEIIPGSNQRVEYAIRLPGDGHQPVWMPIDSKFPTEDYERLEDARQRGDVEAVESAFKAIDASVRLAAKGIAAKYIHSPYSTEFAVLFLPTEGLFAEVIRRPGLVDALQRDHRIMLAGPTTLVSLLVAFRMGFRSLAIQQRSGEVWTVLSAVKTEFQKFGGMLDKVSKKLREAQAIVDDEAGVRRRAMDRKLRGLEILPEFEAASILAINHVDEVDTDHEEPVGSG